MNDTDRRARLAHLMLRSRVRSPGSMVPDVQDFADALRVLPTLDQVAAAIDAVEGVPAGTGEEMAWTLADPGTSRAVLARVAGMATAALVASGESMDEAGEMVAELVR